MVITYDNMDRLFKKGSLYVYTANSTLAAIYILKEVWDETKKENRVYYVTIYNYGKDSTRGKFLSFSEIPSEALRTAIKSSYKKVLQETEFPTLIKLINTVVKQVIKNHKILDSISYTPVPSYECRYNINSYKLFAELYSNSISILIVNPFEEDSVTFTPPNMLMKLIEIDLTINKDNSVRINYVLDKPTTLWKFLQEYPNASRLSGDNKVVTRLAMLWDAITL